MNDKKMVWGISILLIVLVFFVFNRNSCAQQKTIATERSEATALREEIAKLNGRITNLEAQLIKKNGNRIQQNPMVFSSNDEDWDPFADMNAMHRMMSRMMLPMTGAMLSMDDAFNPRIDIKEDGNHYVISMDIPGMNKDKIDVKIENQSLIVSGERSTDTEEKSQGGKVYRHERSFGHFMRALPLPKDAKTNEVDAAYNNGVLTIKVGREVGSKPIGQKITVK